MVEVITLPGGQTKEIGLSPGQTSGYVEGSYISRPADINPSEPYITRSWNEGYAPSELRPVVFKKSPQAYAYHERLGRERAAPGFEPVRYLTKEQIAIEKKEMPEYLRREAAREQANRTQRQYSGNRMFTPTGRLLQQKNYPSFQLPIFSGQQRNVETMKAPAFQLPMFQKNKFFTNATQQRIREEQEMRAKGYFPRVTIEGTTVYSTQPQSVYVKPYGKMISLEESESRYPNIIQKTEKPISKKLDKMFESYITAYEAKTEQRRAETKKAYAGKTDYKFITPKYYIGIENKDLRDYVYGAGKGAAKEPFKAGANVLLSIGLAKVIKPIMAMLPTTTKIAGTVAGGIYGLDVYSRVSTAQRPARTLGEITSTELLPFSIGGFAGLKSGKVRTIKRDVYTPQRRISFLGDVAIESSSYRVGINPSKIGKSIYGDAQQYAKIYAWGKQPQTTISRTYGEGRRSGTIEITGRPQAIKESFTIKNWNIRKPRIMVFPRNIINPRTKNVLSNIQVQSKTSWGGLRRVTKVTGEPQGLSAQKKGAFTIIGKYKPMVRFQLPYMKGEAYVRPEDVLRKLTSGFTTAKAKVKKNLLKDTSGSAQIQMPKIKKETPQGLKYKPEIIPRWKYAVPSMIGAGITTQLRTSTTTKQRNRQLIKNITNIGMRTDLFNLQHISQTPIISLRYGQGLELKQSQTTRQMIRQITKTKTPPRPPTREPPFIRIPKKPPKVYMPSFEMPDIFGQGRRRKQVIKERSIYTRMLQLSDIFGVKRKR